MNKCLRIAVVGDFSESFLQSFIKKSARKYDLEGSAQIVSSGKEIMIVVCGTKESIDSFLDVLHKGAAKNVPESIEVEPFLKSKDYRGVFRIIE